jgi:hypothetical protein
VPPPASFTPTPVPPHPLCQPRQNHARPPHALGLNERHKVRAGAEAAYNLISCAMRPFERTNLDFGTSAECYYKSSTAAIPADVQKARTQLEIESD